MTSVTVEMSNSVRWASFNTEDGGLLHCCCNGSFDFMQRACCFTGGPGEWRVEYLFIFSYSSFSIPQLPHQPPPSSSPATPSQSTKRLCEGFHSLNGTPGPSCFWSVHPELSLLCLLQLGWSFSVPQNQAVVHARSLGGNLPAIR